MVKGKFLFTGDEKLWIRGVTYGTFRSGDGTGFDRRSVEKDFAQIAASGFNALRTYTVPPRWLLDLAEQHDLWVMVGLPWEQHVAFLDSRELQRRIEQTIRNGVRECAGHRAVFCYAIGNEIPTSIVRWHGHRRIEQFLRQLFEAARSQDSSGLFTYVNYPSTEYLELPFLDFLCCNVYIESQDRLQAYLARLQNIAGDRPLVLGEIGLDSRRNGEEVQAQVLDWQVRTTMRAGCAGAFVFAWTDEWHRGGHDIDNWDFGITRRSREAKPALEAVRRSFAELPLQLPEWPRISVVVCSYNGARTIADCCEGLKQLEYPNFEVIIVNDGSTDETEAIAGRYGFRVIATPNRGLAAARNVGMNAAEGEIIAYIDDDARPDPHWLHYLAATFLSTTHVGVGGPNIPPPGDGLIADCIASAPGGPMHVLISDTVAEHIPGCNMAIRKSALQAVGGFDVQFRVAGDDVDICWRLQEAGGTLGFNPGASVLHHRRNSILSYWKQQKGYGKAEALLERKWPEKYNNFGHLTWTGRLYGKGLNPGRIWDRYLIRPGRIYQGIWGSAPFQSRDQTDPGLFGSLLLMPEWFLLLALLFCLSLLGMLWQPLWIAAPVFALGVLGTFVHAGLHGLAATFHGPGDGTSEQVKMRLLTALLHLIQPFARLIGRLRHGLTPWRRRGESGFSMPFPRSIALWSEQWKSLSDRLCVIEKSVRDTGLSVARGGPYDRWDLDVKSGLLGGARSLFSVEEHGNGKQLIRIRTWPSMSIPSFGLALLFSFLAMAAAVEGASIAAVILGSAALLLYGRLLWECGVSTAVLQDVLLRHSVQGTGVIDESESETSALRPQTSAVTRFDIHYAPEKD
jgi:GT2 family glycosyltransferase